MRVSKCYVIHEFLEDHPEAEQSLRLWHKIVSCGCWKNLKELSRTFPESERVGKLTTFSIGNGRFLISATIDYRGQRLFIRNILKSAGHEEQQL